MPPSLRGTKQSPIHAGIASFVAMTAHGALSCNDGHRYEKRHFEMHLANPVHRSSFIVNEKTARNAI
jgi:hypothetical protein